MNLEHGSTVTPPTQRAIPFPKGSLIVSSQATNGSPLENDTTIAALAAAAEQGGAHALRINSPEHVAATAKLVNIPIMGINKSGDRNGVYITPTFEDAQALVEAGASIIALDGTQRPRPDGVTLKEVVTRIQNELGVPVMADCDSLASALYADAAGCDLIATTLTGYTKESEDQALGAPHIELLKEIVQHVKAPVVAEGGFATEPQITAAFRAGAYAVVVGTAITNATEITRTLSNSYARSQRIDQHTAADIILNAIDRVTSRQGANIEAAAKIFLQAIDNGGIIQAFGTGHSRGFAMEIAGRAGGLVPANQLGVKDVVFYGDTPPADILSPELERLPELAHQILDVAEIHPHDCFIIASNSGGNGSTVELALEAKRRGHPVIAVTSLDHSTKITSRHPSGKKLFEVADVVIDNGAVFGDAELPLGAGRIGSIVPVSAVTANLIAQMITAEVCGYLLQRNEQPPVLISANIPEGDEHNEKVRAQYGTRLRVGEP